MKNYLRDLPRVAGIALTTITAGLLLAGCNKTDSSTSGAPSASASTSVPSGGLKSAEKTSFHEVTSQLDPGGSIYGYLSTRQWLEGLSTKAAAWEEVVQALPNVSAADRQNLAKVFAVVTNLIAHSGVEELSGVGLSGIALEPGFYQTKFVVHRNPGKDPGFLWTWGGTEPRPLTELEWLPADTAFAAFGDLDLAAVWGTLKKEVENAGLTEVVAGFNQLEAQVEKGTGKKLTDLLGSLGGQQGMLLTLSSGATVQIPIPNLDPIEIPEPSLLIAIKVKDDQLFDLIDKNLKDVPNVIRTDEKGLKARSMTVPVPLPITLKPTIARHGDYLFIASNDELIKTIIATESGKQPGLKASDEFKRLAKGMPTKGNSLSFVSQRLGTVLQQVQGTVMASAAQTGNEGGEFVQMIQKLVQPKEAVFSYAVGSNTKEGSFAISHGNQEPAQAVLMPLVVVPTAIIAGMTLPALAQAKEKAQSVNCINNLKQIGLASHIWANDHGNRFPSSLTVLTNELGTPRLLMCPKDPQAGDVSALTWATLSSSQISYVLVSPGLSVNASGAASSPLVRCRVHGHTCMGDGHVEAAKSSPVAGK